MNFIRTYTQHQFIPPYHMPQQKSYSPNPIVTQTKIKTAKMRFEFLVGVTGIEPATPCTPCKYSTRLSYTPTNKRMLNHNPTKSNKKIPVKPGQFLIFATDAAATATHGTRFQVSKIAFVGKFLNAAYLVCGQGRATCCQTCVHGYLTVADLEQTGLNQVNQIFCRYNIGGFRNRCGICNRGIGGSTCLV